MSPTLSKRGTIAAVITAFLVVTGPAAHAGTWSHTDPTGDARVGASGSTGEGDIGRVKATANQRTLRLSWRAAPEGTWTNGMFWQLDTVKSDAGPEFMISWTYDLSGRAYLGRIESWTKGWAGGPSATRCKGLKVAAASGSTPGQDYRVPLRCLKTAGVKPARIRVNLESSDLSSSYALDAARGHHRFGRWISTQ
ncbi:hypothetical protein H5V45_01955 [Nocardioides sp. KIGAM211]|uniref:Uncharacterized protein n=1 Tax=Nocardioides luti TaxID=2761101 RepID=A0A7X0RFI9_9ACTN|nr:hypothetical protein [Nocardioides luti]MBB6626074.1 hypothetical protein [Nocardioides luti]